MKRIALAGISMTICLLAGCAQESAAIGIIGGADGPTKIFVATGGAGWWILPLVIVLLAVAGLILLLGRKRK